MQLDIGSAVSPGSFYESEQHFRDDKLNPPEMQAKFMLEKTFILTKLGPVTINYNKEHIWYVLGKQVEHHSGLLFGWGSCWWVPLTTCRLRLLSMETTENKLQMMVEDGTLKNIKSKTEFTRKYLEILQSTSNSACCMQTSRNWMGAEGNWGKHWL